MAIIYCYIVTFAIKITAESASQVSSVKNAATATAKNADRWKSAEGVIASTAEIAKQ